MVSHALGGLLRSPLRRQFRSPFPPSLSLTSRPLSTSLHRLRPQPPVSNNRGALDVQHSEFLANASDKAKFEVKQNEKGTEQDLRRMAQELDHDASDGELIGKLSPTTTHLFKLVLPLPTSLSSYISHIRAKSPHPRIIETAYLLHPSQPLSHVSRLILGSLPNEERAAEVEFRAVSGREHDAYPPNVDEAGEGEGEGDGGVVGAGDGLGDAGGPVLADRQPGGGELQEVRWSTSTDLGDFIKQSTLAQHFNVVVRPNQSPARANTSDWKTGNSPQGESSATTKTETETEPPELILKVMIPTFASRTMYLRKRLLSLTKSIATMTDQKKALDKEAHKSARRFAISGLGGLVAYWGVVFKLTFFSPLGWDVMEPVTYLSGLTTVIGGYLFFLYHQREVSYSSVLDLSVSAKQQQLYTENGLEVEKWTEMVAEAKALRREIAKIAADYDYDWKGQLENLEDVEVRPIPQTHPTSSNSADPSERPQTSAHLTDDNGNKLDIDKTIDEAADLERQTRKKEGTRRHGKGGRGEALDAEVEKGERKAREAANGQGGVRGYHTVSRVGLGMQRRAFSTTARRPVALDERLTKVIEAKLEAYRDAVKQQQDAALATDIAQQIQLAKTIKDIEPLKEIWQEYKNATEGLRQAELLLRDSDPEMKEMAEQEIEDLNASLPDIVAKFPQLLLPPSTTDQLSAILEMKAGVGGDESALFVEEVLRMYIRYAADRNWKTTILGKTAAGIGSGSGGGLKDVTLEVKGEGAFGDFRFERGVHRVQRIPATESAGRVHTSTIAVVVLPLSEASQDTSTDDVVDEKDVKTEVMRSRGAGGQHVNKTESAVRLTHIPTGISVSMQDSRSQHQNRATAWQILRARLLDVKLTRAAEDRRNTRRSQVKGMDRSDKIRTYNFPQDRVTDHRIGWTTTGIGAILEGEGLVYVMDKMKEENQGLRLQSLLETGEDVDE